MDMESSAYVGFGWISSGRKVSENLIDDAARRILKVKFELGCSITHTSIVTKLAKRNGRKC
jgi:beta-glucosidase-like glycosyl hydrolase